MGDRVCVCVWEQHRSVSVHSLSAVSLCSVIQSCANLSWSLTTCLTIMSVPPSSSPSSSSSVEESSCPCPTWLVWLWETQKSGNDPRHTWSHIYLPSLFPSLQWWDVKMGSCVIYENVPLSLQILFLMCTYLVLCSWDRNNNPEPWNKLGPTYQYKVCFS